MSFKSKTFENTYVFLNTKAKLLKTQDMLEKIADLCLNLCCINFKVTKLLSVFSVCDADPKLLTLLFLSSLAVW